MKKTIKLIGIVALVVVIGFSLAGCWSMAMGQPLVWDESIPEEEAVHIYFLYGVEITSYNGIDVPTKKTRQSPIGFVSEWRNVILPAGEITFGLSVCHNAPIIYIAKDEVFKYTFEPGVYTIRFGIEDIFQDDEIWGVFIHEGKAYPKTNNPGKKLDGFISFAPFHK